MALDDEYDPLANGEDGVDLNMVELSAEEMNALDREVAQGAFGTDEDAAPSRPQVPVTMPGDVWLLDKHRLVCGDSTRAEVLGSVLIGDSADMVFCDPPYNVGYEGKTADRLKIENDSLGEDFYPFLRRSCENMLAVTRGAVYICMSASELHTLYRAFKEAGGHWSTYIIWDKHRFTLGRSDYQRQYEPILYGWNEHGPHYWCGARDEADVWSINRSVANTDHPTMKPVELVERALRNSSKSGAVVLDPFGGSGTTLIACERMGRRARLVELDPGYCDVTIDRWQKLFGKRALLEGVNTTFDAIRAHRLRFGLGDAM